MQSPIHLLWDEPALDAGLPNARVRRLSDRLTFAFARGTDEADLIGLVLPEFGTPSVSKASLSGDLFLDELLDSAFSIQLRGRRYEPCRSLLLNLFLSPPKSLGDTRFRQEIFRELDGNPERLRGLEEAYEALRIFRSALCGGDGGGRSGSVRRRIEILATFSKAVFTVKKSFAPATSGLRRASLWADEFIASEPMQQLTRLLDFEDKRTVLEGRLQFGYDGTLRRFDITGLEEVAAASFSRGPLSRFFRQCWALMRGYRFSEEDVMSLLLDQIFTSVEADVFCLLRLSVELEFYLAGMSFQRFAAKWGAPTCLPTFSEHSRKLLGLTNPWLLGQGKTAVPCDFVQAEARGTVIITGPNSGGKTRLLQAISATQLLGQLGLFVPAREAELVWAPDFFLSLIERPASNQEEGRLGMELLRIRKVFETAGAGALVVMDELCSGTNPSEGEQIFEMVLDLFGEVRPQVFISTHFLDFAARIAEKRPDFVDFLQVELGPHDIPTYQFIPGVAKTSMARATAARLGVTREELLELALRRRTHP